MDDAEQCLLLETSDQTELHIVQGLLEANGISFVTQGGHHAQMLAGLGQPLLVLPRILVASRDLERARQLLLSRPTLQGPASQQAIDDAVCPVHQLQAVATCDRCGTFLCSSCGTLGDPPLCESCVATTDAPRRRLGNQTVGLVMIVGPAVFFIVLALVIFLITKLSAK